MLILGLESSCDETSAAVVRMDGERREILSNIVASQIDIHRLYGGVVPEIASREFKGIIVVGLMLTADGPRVLDYNARVGDPETQVVLPLLESDLLTVMQAVTNGTLAETEVRGQSSLDSPGVKVSIPELRNLRGLGLSWG